MRLLFGRIFFRASALLLAMCATCSVVSEHVPALVPSVGSMLLMAGSAFLSAAAFEIGTSQ